MKDSKYYSKKHNYKSKKKLQIKKIALILIIIGITVPSAALVFNLVRIFLSGHHEALACDNKKSDIGIDIDKIIENDNVNSTNCVDHTLHKQDELDRNKNIEMSENDVLGYDFSSWNASAPPELRVINKNNPIPENYVLNLESFQNKKVNKIIYEFLKNMIDDAKKVGLNIFVCSGYRSIEYQRKLFKNQVEFEKHNGFDGEKAIEKASESVAKPGQSEHNLGISVDLNCVNGKFRDTCEYRWLKENAHKYGFIERYMKETEDETGVVYEPWHWRYVGSEFAKEIKSSGKTFERFIIENKILCG